jgi:hypothetical protein
MGDGLGAGAVAGAAPTAVGVVGCVEKKARSVKIEMSQRSDAARAHK